MAGFVLWPLLAASSIAVLSIFGWRKSWPLDLVGSPGTELEFAL